jgi:hypothetical protein
MGGEEGQGNKGTLEKRGNVAGCRRGPLSVWAGIRNQSLSKRRGHRREKTSASGRIKPADRADA